MYVQLQLYLNTFNPVYIFFFGKTTSILFGKRALTLFVLAVPRHWNFDATCRLLPVSLFKPPHSSECPFRHFEPQNRWPHLSHGARFHGLHPLHSPHCRQNFVLPTQSRHTITSHCLHRNDPRRHPSAGQQGTLHTEHPWLGSQVMQILWRSHPAKRWRCPVPRQNSQMRLSQAMQPRLLWQRRHHVLLVVAQTRQGEASGSAHPLHTWQGPRSRSNTSSALKVWWRVLRMRRMSAQRISSGFWQPRTVMRRRFGWWIGEVASESRKWANAVMVDELQCWKDSVSKDGHDLKVVLKSASQTCWLSNETWRMPIFAAGDIFRLRSRVRRSAMVDAGSSSFSPSWRMRQAFVTLGFCCWSRLMS